jgi:carbonic anhydrase/acetyltransferase-like protein (isoleucine patch superfamily)|tara:strand:+ start:494 stop:1012 length:519 start_codon:yes stop_codon:yes gene_type:complete
MPIYALGNKEPQIASDAYIHPEAVIIGDVTIGSESSVWPCAVLRGDDGEIIVGDRSNIQDGAVLHTTFMYPTIVGNNCTIGHLAHLEGCRILDNALVGTAAVVLHDAEVQQGALVGANAVVTGGSVIPPGAMALGIPAKVREGMANQKEILLGVESYVNRGKWFRKDLRRLD